MPKLQTLTRIAAIMAGIGIGYATVGGAAQGPKKGRIPPALRVSKR
jgi:hypothetical protein